MVGSGNVRAGKSASTYDFFSHVVHRCRGIAVAWCRVSAACCLLPAACCLLPAACCLLPAVLLSVDHKR